MCAKRSSRSPFIFLAKVNPPEAPARNTGECVPHLMLLNSFSCDHSSSVPCEASRHTQILLSLSLSLLMRGEKQVPSVQGSNLGAPSIMEPIMCVPES